MLAPRKKMCLKTAETPIKFLFVPGKGVRGAGREAPRLCSPLGGNFEKQVSSKALSSHLRPIFLHYGSVSLSYIYALLSLRNVSKSTLRLIKTSSLPTVDVLKGIVPQNSKYRSTPKLGRETQCVRMLQKYGSLGFLKKIHGIQHQTPCKSLQSYPKIDQKIIVSSRSCSDRNSSTKLQISIDAKTWA